MPSKTIMTFPCEFHLKVFGHNNESFEKKILTIVKKHCPNLKKNSLKIKLSKKNKYLSITITTEAKNKEQLDALYRELNQAPDVIMTL